MLKPPKFHGQTSFETFWAQFTNCAEHNKWTKAEKLVYLRSSLDKDVANVLWDYDKDVTNSLSGLTKILESRYGSKSFANKHRIELRNRRRRKGESISNLHVDIRLVALAFPKVERKVRESIACDHFLDALDDPELALKIRERQPSDLDAALRIALQLEAWTTDTTRLKEAKSDRVEPRRVREISHPSEPTKDTFQEMEKRIAELESRLAKTNYNVPSTYGSNRGNNRNRYTNANSNSNSYANSNLKCFRCGDATHLVRNSR